MTAKDERLQSRTVYVATGGLIPDVHSFKVYGADGHLFRGHVHEHFDRYIFTRDELAELMKEEIRKAWSDAKDSIRQNVIVDNWGHYAGLDDEEILDDQETYLTGRLKELGLEK